MNTRYPETNSQPKPLKIGGLPLEVSLEIPNLETHPFLGAENVSFRECRYSFVPFLLRVPRIQ